MPVQPRAPPQRVLGFDVLAAGAAGLAAVIVVPREGAGTAFPESDRVHTPSSGKPSDRHTSPNTEGAFTKCPTFFRHV